MVFGCSRHLLQACSACGDGAPSTSGLSPEGVSSTWQNIHGLHTRAASSDNLLASAPDAISLSASCPASTSQLAFDAASTHEQLALLFSPTQLGVQLLEAVHSSTGLPWWASIPATALALRTLLAPLSLKAKAASANIVLLHHSFSEARLMSADMEPAAAASLGRSDLVKRVYRLLRARHGTPSLRWYWLNAAVQVRAAGRQAAGGRATPTNRSWGQGWLMKGCASVGHVEGRAALSCDMPERL